MGKNLAIGVLVVAVLGGAIWYYTANPVTPVTPTDTTPVAGTDPGTYTPPSQQAGTPIAVTDPTAIPTDTTVVVTGQVTPQGAFTNYWYEYGKTANLGSRTTDQGVGGSFTAIPAPAYITGLTAQTTYYFKLMAKNQLGVSAGTAFTFTTTKGTLPPVGNVPTARTLASTNVSRTSANVSGEVTPNQAETTFWFEYGTTKDLGAVSVFQSAGSGMNKVPTTVTLNDLQPLTTYHFRLNAQNRFGTVLGSILTFKTLGPAAATAPMMETKSETNVSTSSVTLRGSVDPNGAETQYWFEYSTDSLLGNVLANATPKKSAGAGTSATSVSENVTGLAGKTTYYFRIVASNSIGLTRGTEMSFKTK